MAFKHLIATCFIISLLFCIGGCGAVGSPIPPEDVGIEAKVREHRQQTSRDADATDGEDVEETPIEEEPVSLPPLHPIGTR